MGQLNAKDLKKTTGAISGATFVVGWAALALWGPWWSSLVLVAIALTAHYDGFIDGLIRGIMAQVETEDKP